VQSFLSDTARKLKMWILGGTILIRSKTDRRVANASLLIDAAGKRVARYDKIHLVPFGEYIPLPGVFPFLSRLVPFDESLIAGKRLGM